jgi:hypothetical protein
MADGVVAQVTYQADSFAAATIDRFGRTLTVLADEFASHPRTTLSAAFATLSRREA